MTSPPDLPPETVFLLFQDGGYRPQTGLVARDPAGLIAIDARSIRRNRRS